MIPINDNAYDSNLLTEGSIYTVGLNDGTTFKKSVYVGTQLLNGKPIMVFDTTITVKGVEKSKQLTINPSYHSFTLEEETEINEYIVEQAKDAWDSQQQAKR